MSVRVGGGRCDAGLLLRDHRVGPEGTVRRGTSAKFWDILSPFPRWSMPNSRNLSTLLSAFDPPPLPVRASYMYRPLDGGAPGVAAGAVPAERGAAGHDGERPRQGLLRRGTPRTRAAHAHLQGRR